MLTDEQKKWLAHLDNEKIVEILPYNPKTKDVFVKIKNEIKGFLPNAEVLHRGSSALGILGQGEIDLYIPVSEKDFDRYLEKSCNHFGKAGSVYALKRARFVKYIDGIKIEIFLINKDSADWKDSLKFENYLKENPKALEKYKQLKENSKGLSVQQYYTKKLEFINEILNNGN